MQHSGILLLLKVFTKRLQTLTSFTYDLVVQKSLWKAESKVKFEDNLLTNHYLLETEIKERQETKQESRKRMIYDFFQISFTHLFSFLISRKGFNDTISKIQHKVQLLFLALLNSD